jgi:hypothetical protein
MKNFIGQDGFIWWIGKVVDIDDPLTLGRCKVRIFGYHGEEKDIPNEDLPWATAIHPVNTPNFYGTPKEDDWVFGFFLDSLSAQEPAMMGYFPYHIDEEERNFKEVKQKDSVVLDINGAKIEISNTGIVTIASANAVTIQGSTLTFKDATNTLTLQQIKTGLDLGLVLPEPPPSA